LIKPNFCFDLSHQRSTTVSLETRNPFTLELFVTIFVDIHLMLLSFKGFMHFEKHRLVQVQFDFTLKNDCPYPHAF